MAKKNKEVKNEQVDKISEEVETVRGGEVDKEVNKEGVAKVK